MGGRGRKGLANFSLVFLRSVIEEWLWTLAKPDIVLPKPFLLNEEEGFFPWEIARLEDCEPEVSGGHLAFVEKKQ